jgi:hypothetical protein
VRPAGPPVEGAARRRRHGGVRLDDAEGPLGALVGRPTIMETTALGAAYLVGLQSASIPIHRRSQRAGRSTAAMDETTRSRRIVAWKHTSAARWAAMTLHARHRMPASISWVELMRAGRRTYVSVGAVGDLPFCSGALSSPSVER